MRKMRNKHCSTWNMARNTEYVGKWEMHTVGHVVCRENWILSKWKTHTVGHEVWQETLKTWRMRNSNCRTWNMARKMKKHGKWEKHTVRHGICRKTLKNVENETQTLHDLECGEKNWKSWKMINALCRTWNVVRKLNIMENEKHTL